MREHVGEQWLQILDRGIAFRLFLPVHKGKALLSDTFNSRSRAKIASVELAGVSS